MKCLLDVRGADISTSRGAKGQRYVHFDEGSNCTTIQLGRYGVKSLRDHLDTLIKSETENVEK